MCVKRCHIVGAGSIYEGDLPVALGEEDLLIAADGGWQYLQQAGQTPHLLIGDFDSMQQPNTSCETHVLPVEKDDTDLVYAVKQGFLRGYTQFALYGGMGGGRLSHTLANLQLLAYIKEQGGHGELIGGKTKLFLLKEESYTFPAEQTGHCSLLAFSDCATVSSRGLYYPLQQQEITNTFPLGVSNHFVGNAEVTVHDGQLLVVVEE